jgi:fimbrial chaperone protein
MGLHLKRCGMAAVLALALACEIYATGTFSVTPVRIYMNAKDRAVAVTITNDGDQPVVLQAELFSWSQSADGSDQLALTDDLILSPPIIKLAPKAKQVVRLARAKPMNLDRQITYRMVMRQIPEAVQPKDNIQVPIALALSMPVFITPPSARPKLTCQAERAEAGALRVRCANSGSAYTQVRQMVLREGDRILGRFEGGEYILPGAKKTLTIKTEGALPPRLELVVTYDDGRSEVFQVAVG